MSQQRKRENNRNAYQHRKLSAADSGARDPDSTDVIRPHYLPFALPANRQVDDGDDDKTTILQREDMFSVKFVNEEHALAVEGRLTRSIAPHPRSWKRRAYWLLPALAFFGAFGLSTAATTSWLQRVPALRGLEPTPVVRAIPLAHLEPVATEEPKSEPAVASAAPVPVPVIEDEPIVEEAAVVDTEPAKIKGTRARYKHHRAMARAAHAKKARAKHAALARRIQPPSEPTTAADDSPSTDDAAASLGTLQVNSRPWARVTVDGTYVGNTPQLALRLAPGTHHVLLVNTQLEMSKTVDVVIAPGQTVKCVELLEENLVSTQ